MRASAPTRVECSLVEAQNALMRQSQMDSQGIVHGHGWGVADYRDGPPSVERQTWAAFHGEHFRKAAARVYANTVVAHVRHATIGGPALENTHPFQHGRWTFAHNGMIPNFPAVRDLMIGHIDPVLRNDINGVTDSEHIFYYILSRYVRHPERPLIETVREALVQVVHWTETVGMTDEFGLNIVLTDGEQLVGSCYGRTLWTLRRDSVTVCDVCGKTHVHLAPGQDYRAIEIASEPITDENWQQVPEGTVYAIDSNIYLITEQLFAGSDRGLVASAG